MAAAFASVLAALSSAKSPGVIIVLVMMFWCLWQLDAGLRASVKLEEASKQFDAGAFWRVRSAVILVGATIAMFSLLIITALT